MNVMHRSRLLILSVALALLGGCGGFGGGGHNYAEPVMGGCVMGTSGRWAVEVNYTSIPIFLKFCPTKYVVKRYTNFNLIVDVRKSRNFYVNIHPGFSRMYTKHLAAGDAMQDSGEVSFYNTSPMMTTVYPYEYPARALYTVNWEIGRTPSNGHYELDSLDVSYPDSAGNRARAWVIFPVVKDTAPGILTGDSYLAPGQAGHWLITPTWDTTGYAFQWYLGATALTGEQSASLTHTFSSLGTYSLRVDQWGIDSSVLSSNITVNVPLRASVSGPSNISPNVQYTWTAVVTYGTAPLTYQWYVDNVPAGTASTLDYTFTTAASIHFITVDVVDAGSFTASSDPGYGVNVNSGSCDPEDPDCHESRPAPIKASTLPPKIPVRKP